MAYISFSTIQKKFIYIILFCILIGLFYFPLVLFFNEKDSNNFKINKNKLLQVFLYYLGHLLCFFPSLIIKYKSKRNKISIKNEYNKRDSKIIEYIFNDPSDKLHNFKIKNIIFLFIISLISILGDFLVIFIEEKEYSKGITQEKKNENNNKEEYKDIFSFEEYYFFEYFFFLIFSISILKVIYYKHQYYSIILLMIFGIFRYLYVINFDISKKILIELIIAFIDCIIYGYIKGLMEYNYFSIYKCCYIFGFINVPIIIIIYFIVSYIPCDSFCDLEFGKDNPKKYFDNIYSLFTGEINRLEIILYIVYTFVEGGFQLLINETLNRFTIYHILFIIQIIGFIIDILKVKEKIGKLIIIICCGFIELFFTLVFLEIIELNFCGLNKNLKKNIMNRSIEDSNISNIYEDDDEEQTIDDNNKQILQLK